MVPNTQQPTSNNKTQLRNIVVYCIGDLTPSVRKPYQLSEGSLIALMIIKSFFSNYISAELKTGTMYRDQRPAAAYVPGCYWPTKQCKDASDVPAPCLTDTYYTEGSNHFSPVPFHHFPFEARIYLNQRQTRSWRPPPLLSCCNEWVQHICKQFLKLRLLRN